MIHTQNKDQIIFSGKHRKNFSWYRVGMSAELAYNRSIGTPLVSESGDEILIKTLMTRYFIARIRSTTLKQVTPNYKK